jgi:hypothetical protein
VQYPLTQRPEPVGQSTSVLQVYDTGKQKLPLWDPVTWQLLPVSQVMPVAQIGVVIGKLQRAGPHV